jgi:phage shock protein E
MNQIYKLIMKRIKRIVPVLILLISISSFLEAQTKKEVNSKVVSVMLQKDAKLVVLDVRTADEFKEGHIKGAINIDIRREDAFARIDKLNRNVPYVVYCRTNHRSGMAVDHMMKSRFKKVYQMMDGFPGWAENKLPVQK